MKNSNISHYGKSFKAGRTLADAVFRYERLSRYEKKMVDKGKTYLVATVKKASHQREPREKNPITGF